MTAGVYAIVNTATGMAYVGSSVNIERRWDRHRSSLKRNSRFDSPRALIAAWVAAAGEGFEWRILEVVPPVESLLVVAEQRWLDHFKDRCYNVRMQARRWPNEDPVQNRLDRRKTPYWDRPRRTPKEDKADA